MIAGGAPDDCWNRIGVRGDRTCERLREHLHCHNCEIYADAARRIRRRNVPPGYLRDWATVFAQPEQEERIADASALIFRVGAEWLAMPGKLCVTIGEKAAVHKLPHRSGKILTGIVNVKGRLYPCASLADLFDIDTEYAFIQAGRIIYPRLMVMQFQQHAFALPVDEVHGIQAYVTADLQMPPATVNKGIHRYLMGILSTADMTVGCLDPDLVGYNLTKCLR